MEVMIIYVDYDMGMLLKDEIVPNALKWYLGEVDYDALDEDYEDDEDEEDDDEEEEEDEDEEEEEEDVPPRHAHSKAKRVCY
jgi:nucleosome assembly protein 1-like 1